MDLYNCKDVRLYSVARDNYTKTAHRTCASEREGSMRSASVRLNGFNPKAQQDVMTVIMIAQCTVPNMAALLHLTRPPFMLSYHGSALIGCRNSVAGACICFICFESRR